MTDKDTLISIVIVMAIGVLMWALFWPWRESNVILNIIACLFFVSAASVGWCIDEWLHYRKQKRR